MSGSASHTRSGPPTPDDLDELLSRRRKTHCLLAHPWRSPRSAASATHEGSIRR
ncbi:hypothetical protein [Nonomuraea dietziae]|uniref:hypothetical protein n=1 Tax=Nonomuraea dietziae TaxID=65515 RepID=UPI003CD06B74